MSAIDGGGGEVVAVGLYPRQALLNHSCEPNVSRHFGKQGVQELRLLCDINAGEELTMDYLGSDAPASERRRLLLERYGFLCKCPLCVQECGEPEAPATELL